HARAGAIVGSSLTIFLILVSPVVRGQSPTKEKPALVSAGADEAATDPASRPRFEYYGSSNCQRCHFNPIQEDFDSGRIYFIGMNESQTWSLHDRHSKAFKLVQCERGRAIGRRLGWNVTADQRCLSCHADWQSDRQSPDETMLSEGVACEACHGPS